MTPTRPRGRQCLYNDAQADEIIERIAAGEGLQGICRDDHMPAASTVRWWVVDDRSGFAARYALARQLQADYLAEETREIADACDDWQKARLQVDVRKWFASKMFPNKYGERSAVELNHSGDMTIRGDAQIESRILELLGKAGTVAIAGGEGAPEDDSGGGSGA